MRPIILLLSVAVVGCQGGLDSRQDNPDGRQGSPDASQIEPDASPIEPDAWPGADASPGDPDASPSADASPGDPDAGVSSPAPTVITLSPAADLSGVEPSVDVVVTFSSDLAESTVNAQTFSLTTGGAPVAGTVHYADRVATFDPAAPLALDRTYSATVTTGITDPIGQPLEAGATWSFSIRDGAWTAATQIDLVGDSSAASPELAADDLGNVTAVWGENYELFATRFEPDNGWGTGVQLTTEEGRSGDFDVAAAPGGEVVVAWSQARGTHEDLVVRRFNAGAWGAITTLDPDTVHNAAETDVAFSRDGDAMVTWTRWTGEDHELWACHLEGAWGAPVLLAEGGNEEYEWHDLYLGADASGNYVAVFGQDGNPDGWVTEYVADTGWGAATAIPLPHGLWVSVSEVSLDASGTITTGWSDHPNGVESTVHALQRTGGTWTATRLDQAPGSRSYGVQIAVAPSGEAVAIWRQLDDGPTVWSSRFVVGSGWGEPVRLSAAGMQVWGGAELAIGDDGHAFAVWTEQAELAGTEVQLHASHQAVGAAWSDAVQLSTGFRAGQPSVTVDATGAATAAWWQIPDSSNISSIWAGRFE